MSSPASREPFDYGERLPDGQHKRHPTLSAFARQLFARQQFVRPVRDRYRHIACGTITVMGRSIAETYAAQPDFYSSTFCKSCRGYFPVGADGDFDWIEAHGSRGPKVGT